MEIRRETEPYNEKRYGKPWIARVDFRSNKKGEFIWGDWIGDHSNGGSGTLVVSADPGDIVARGQKDYRKAKNSSPDFYEVQADGKMAYLGDRGAAYKHFVAQNQTEMDTEALTSERDRLLKRLAEIDTLLAE